MGMKKAINENFNGVEIYKFQLPQGVNATSTEHIAINYGKINYWDEETNSLKKIDNSRNNYLESIINADPVTIQNYRTYKDAVQNSPVDGIGSGSSLVLSANTASPISGEADIQIVKTASNLQGEGVSIDFQIERKDNAKILQIEANLRLISGTYTKGDLRFYIIQDPNGTPLVIEPDNVEIETGSTGTIIKHLALFQTHATILNYRLCIHVATTSTSAYTLDFNNLKIWEQEKNYGAFISDWQDFTPTGSFTTNTTYSGKWRRIGSDMEVQTRLYFTGTPNTISELHINIPQGYSVDFNKLTSGLFDRSNFGQGVMVDIGTSKVYELVIKEDGNNSILVGFISPEVPYVVYGVVTNLIPFTIDSNDYIVISYKVPIQGWSSNMILSSDAGDGQLTVGYYYATTGEAFTPGITKLKFNLRKKDTSDCYNPITGEITIPTSGDYAFSLNRLTLTSGSTSINSYVNNAVYGTIGTLIISTEHRDAEILMTDLKAGDIVDFRFSESATSASVTESYINFYKLGSGNQTIALDEKVYFRYGHIAGSTVPAKDIDGNWLIPKYTVKDNDSHGIYNTSTGEITIPSNGNYLITIGVYVSMAIADQPMTIELLGSLPSSLDYRRVNTRSRGSALIHSTYVFQKYFNKGTIFYPRFQMDFNIVGVMSANVIDNYISLVKVN